jgi:hypothetical protein
MITLNSLAIGLCDASKPGHRNYSARRETPAVLLDALDFP